MSDKRVRSVAGIERRNPNSPETNMLVATEIRSGILPAPDDLERYEKLVPGITDRLMKTYEMQVNHRVHIENVVIEGDSKRANRGQIFGFITVLVVLGIAVFLMIKGYSIGGLGTLVAALATLVGVFIGTSANRRAERQKKNSADGKKN